MAAVIDEDKDERRVGSYLRHMKNTTVSGSMVAQAGDIQDFVFCRVSPCFSGTPLSPSKGSLKAAETALGHLVSQTSYTGKMPSSPPTATSHVHNLPGQAQAPF